MAARVITVVALGEPLFLRQENAPQRARYVTLALSICWNLD